MAGLKAVGDASLHLTLLCLTLAGGVVVRDGKACADKSEWRDVSCVYARECGGMDYSAVAVSVLRLVRKSRDNAALRKLMQCVAAKCQM